MENYPARRQRRSGPPGPGLTGLRNRGYTHYPLTVLVLPGNSSTAGGYKVVLEHRLGAAIGATLLPRFLAALEKHHSRDGPPLAAGPALLPGGAGRDLAEQHRRPPVSP